MLERNQEGCKGGINDQIKSHEQDAAYHHDLRQPVLKPDRRQYIMTVLVTSGVGNREKDGSANAASYP